MIGVCVGHHHRVKPPDTTTTEKGNDGALPGIPPPGAGTAVYQHPVATGRPDGDPITLPYIEKM
jgi:hypothetical protein